MSDESDLANRLQQLEAQVGELREAIEALLQNPNGRELSSLSPSEIETRAKASVKRSTKR
jgi:hypothetical protein